MHNDSLTHIWNKALVRISMKDYNQYELKLLQCNFQLSILELEEIRLNIDTDYKDIWNLIYLSILNQNPSIKPKSISDFTKHFSMLRLSYPECSLSLLQTYHSTFLDWINLCKSCKQILICLTALEGLIKNEQVYVDILSLAETKFSAFTWEKIYKILSGEGLDNAVVTKTLKTLKKAEKLGMNIKCLAEILCLHSISYIESFADCNNVEVQSMNNSAKIDACRGLLAEIIRFIDLSSEINNRVRRIIEKLNITPKELPNINIKEESKMLILQEETSKLRLTVYKAENKVGNPMLIKHYISKSDINVLNFVHDEILELKKLSDCMNENNCFPMFYGHTLTKDSISLYIEYGEYNLIERLTKLKAERSAPDKKLEAKIYKLLFSFSQMEELSIYYRDISAQSIIIASDGDLKIINIGIYHQYYQQLPEDIWKIEISLILSIYSAPEAIELSRENNISKCNIFSLGLIILEIVSLVDLTGLNMKQNHESLLMEIAIIETNFIRDLLMKMLVFNPEERPCFKELLRFVPVANTLFT